MVVVSALTAEGEVGGIVETTGRGVVWLLAVTILAVTVVWPVLQMVAADAIFDARLGSPMVLTQEEQGWANSAYWAEFEHRHWVNAKGDMFELIVEAHATQVASKPLQMMLRHCSLANESAV